jgi:protein KTI12
VELHVGTPQARCRENNASLLADPAVDGGYDPDDFENLLFRYEEPNGMTRWDSPLFLVVEEDSAPPCAAMWDALVGTDGKPKVVKPNLATVLVRVWPRPAHALLR